MASSPSSGNFSFSTDEEHVLVAITDFTTAISLIGSCFIIGCYVLIRTHRVFAFKLVLFLAISDAFSTIANAMSALGGYNGLPTGTACTVQAVLVSFFGSAR